MNAFTNRDYGRQKEAPRERSTLRREIRALDVVIPPIPLRTTARSSPLSLVGFDDARLVSEYSAICQVATVASFFRELSTMRSFCRLNPRELPRPPYTYPPNRRNNSALGSFYYPLKGKVSKARSFIYILRRLSRVVVVRRYHFVPKRLACNMIFSLLLLTDFSFFVFQVRNVRRVTHPFANIASKSQM